MDMQNLFGSDDESGEGGEELGQQARVSAGMQVAWLHAVLIMMSSAFAFNRKYHASTKVKFLASSSL